MLLSPTPVGAEEFADTYMHDASVKGGVLIEIGCAFLLPLNRKQHPLSSIGDISHLI
jgi:hypothetical protein